jgi:hypothetical protein
MSSSWSLSDRTVLFLTELYLVSSTGREEGECSMRWTVGL